MNIKVWIARDYPLGMREGRLRAYVGKDDNSPIWFKDHWNSNGEFAFNIPREMFPEIYSGECIELTFNKKITEINQN